MRSGRRVTGFVSAGTAAVLLAAAVVAKRPIQREWFTWRFATGDEGVKREAARRLVELGALEVAALWYRERFERGDDSVRAEVAGELVAIGARPLAESLYLESLLSGLHERFGPAVHWLQMNGDATTARRLLSRLRAVTESSAIDPHDREDAAIGLFTAVSSIVEREQQTAVPVLIEFVETPGNRPGVEYQARNCAAYLLAGLGRASASAIPALSRHLDDEDETFRAAVEYALAQIRPAAGTP